MDFPLICIPPPEECYHFLKTFFHGYGFKCPAGHDLANSRVHRRHRAPIIDYQCGNCGRIFNIFTGTVLQGTKYTVTQLIQCFDGISRGISISRLAREMNVDRKGLGKTCAKIKDLLPQVEKKSPPFEWISILEDIEWWAMEDDPEGSGGTRLVVKIKNGAYYALVPYNFIKIDPVSLKRLKVKYTKVHQLKEYFPGKRSPK